VQLANHFFDPGALPEHRRVLAGLEGSALLQAEVGSKPQLLLHDVDPQVDVDFS